MTSTKNDDFITKISSLFEPKKTQISNVSTINDTINVTSKKTTNNEFLGESNKFNNYNNLSSNGKKVLNNSNMSQTKNTISSKKTSKQSNTKSLQEDNNSELSFFGNDPNKSSQKSSNSNKEKNSMENIAKTIEKSSTKIPTEGFNIKTILLWIGIFILLAFLGFNIFSTLGNVTDSVANIFKPILSLFGLATVNLTSKSLDVATEGTKGLANATTNVFDSGLDIVNNTTQSGLSFLKNRISNKSSNESKDNNLDKLKSEDNDKSQDNDKSKDNDKLEKIDTYNKKDVDKLSAFIDSNFDNINKFQSHNNKSCKSNCLKKCTNETGSDKCNLHCDKYCDEVIPDPDPVIDNSRVQSNRASGKSGFCYVGEENGIRSCVRVSEHDICTSGKIYSSQEICRNPKLRK